MALQPAPLEEKHEISVSATGAGAMPLLCDFIEHELELFHMNIRVSYRIPVVLVHAEIGFTQDEQHNYMSALF